MPTYQVLQTTYISHEGRTVPAGETVTINWPEGCEPKKLGSNLAEVKTEPKAKGKKAEDDLT